LQYVANIISTDTLEITTNYRSPILDELIKKKKEKIIELAKNNVKDFKIPSFILKSNQTINLDIQNRVYLELKNRDSQKKDIYLPSVFKYEVFKTILCDMYELYDWKNSDKKLQNKNVLSYYALLMNQWINGFGLNYIINESLKYYENRHKKIKLNFNEELVDFNPNNKEHINHIIENIIDDIEYVIRFLLEKYFNHYYQVVVSILGEQNAGENWALLLEYGTQNRIAIALQNIGLSRHTALKIFKDCKDALSIKDGKLEKIDRDLILNKLKKNSLEYEEILNFL
jgi:hypothetical protein